MEESNNGKWSPPSGEFADTIRHLRETQFPHIKDAVYLDHAGATLYSKDQVVEHSNMLLSNLLGNPHSGNPSSMATTQAVENVRNIILRYFGTSASEHAVVFTQGATASLKLVAETFAEDESDVNKPSNEKDPPVFCYMDEAHTSVVGMRETMAHRGYRVASINLDSFKPHDSKIHDTSHTQRHINLLAMPAQCNFSGRKFPLSLVNRVRDGDVHISNQSDSPWTWKVVLDAASFVSTSPLNLHRVKADFVCLSFYKMFGFPTGIGALIVRRESAHLLSKIYYGGGTVSAYSGSEAFHIPKERVEDRLEDGTLPFLSILALKVIDFIDVDVLILNVRAALTGSNRFVWRTLATTPFSWQHTLITS
eukprot:m.118895 g.118895  ORF g.118895 m.118895 type:complete len:365 (+) comp14295_c0_seq3:103-1197(+)